MVSSSKAEVRNMLKRLPPRGCAAVLGFSMGTVPWRKILWGAGMSLDKSKG